MLSPKIIDQIEDIIFSDDFAEQAMDYFGLHGLACAQAVGPCEIDESLFLESVLGENYAKASSEQKSVLRNALLDIQEIIEQAISEGQLIELPYEEEEEDDFEDAMTSWCVGFIEGMLANEAAWFEQNEDQCAELLLPFMALSGLYETTEFKKMWSNDKLMAQFASIIPDQLVDIFLYYHSS